MIKPKQLNLVIALALIVLAVSLRLIPHPANFAPVTAVAIFGGAVLPRKLSILVPLLAMMVSDFFIGFYAMMPLTWACYVLIALASSLWFKNKLRLGIAITLSGSMFFFIVTNFGVWLTSGMYAHTCNGLIRCYTLALPFFRNTALSDAFYTTALFGVFALANTLVTKYQLFEIKTNSGQHT